MDKMEIMAENFLGKNNGDVEKTVLAMAKTIEANPALSAVCQEFLLTEKMKARMISEICVGQVLSQKVTEAKLYNPGQKKRLAFLMKQNVGPIVATV